MRGFAAVGLENVKCPANVGSAMRAVHVFSAALLIVKIGRFKNARHVLRNVATDPQCAWRHVPVITTEQSVLEYCPIGATPVAVEIHPGRCMLPDFDHPESAFYIFGPEDGSLSVETSQRCERAVQIPSAYCLNLAAAVNVTLYDRAAKQPRSER